MCSRRLFRIIVVAEMGVNPSHRCEYSPDSPELRDEVHGHVHSRRDEGDAEQKREEREDASKCEATPNKTLIAIEHVIELPVKFVHDEN